MTPFRRQHTAWETPFPEVNSDFLIARSRYLKSLFIVSQLLKNSLISWISGFPTAFLVFVVSVLCLVFLFPLYILSCWNAIILYPQLFSSFNFS